MQVGNSLAASGSRHDYYELSHFKSICYYIPGLVLSTLNQSFTPFSQRLFGVFTGELQ